MPEAVEYGMTICEYEPDNPAAKAYEKICKGVDGKWRPEHQKIPARSTLLNASLDGMDDLFDFKTKDDLSQPEQEKRRNGNYGNGLCCDGAASKS